MTDFFYDSDDIFCISDPLAEGPLWEGLEAWLSETNTEDL